MPGCEAIEVVSAARSIARRIAWRWVCGLGLTIVFGGDLAAAEPAPAPRFATAGQVPEILISPASITWDGQALREAVTRLAEQNDLGAVVDRRLDPSQRLLAGIYDRPLHEIFTRIAVGQPWEIALVGPVVYCGPTSTARDLATVVLLREDDVRKLSSNERFRWNKLAPLSWPDLTPPREVLDQLAAEQGLRIEGLEQIPHDLWAGVRLPPLTLAARLSLILAQFDLTFRFDDVTGRKLTIVAWPVSPVVTKTYASGTKGAERAAAWRKLVPEAEIKLAGRQIQVIGRAEDHAAIAVDLHPPKPRPRAAGEKTFTLRVENKPLAAVLQAVCAQLSCELDWDRVALERSGVKVDQLIQVEVQDVSADGLFQAILRPAGLVHRRDGNRVRVTIQE